MKCPQCQAEMVSSKQGWLCPVCGHVSPMDIGAAEITKEVVSPFSATPDSQSTQKFLVPDTHITKVTGVSEDKPKFFSQLYLLICVVIVGIGIGLASLKVNSSPDSYMGLFGLFVLPLFLLLSPLGWLSLALALLTFYCVARSNKVRGSQAVTYIIAAKFFGLAVCATIAYSIYGLVTSAPTSES